MDNITKQVEDAASKVRPHYKQVKEKIVNSDIAKVGDLLLELRQVLNDLSIIKIDFEDVFEVNRSKWGINVIKGKRSSKKFKLNICGHAVDIELFYNLTFYSSCITPLYLIIPQKKFILMNFYCFLFVYSYFFDVLTISRRDLYSFL